MRETNGRSVSSILSKMCSAAKRRMHTVRFLAAILALVLCLGISLPSEAATSPKLNKTKVTLQVKKTATLKVSGTKSKVKWSSSNKSIAIVSSSGKVTAKKPGEATISAKVDKKT